MLTPVDIQQKKFSIGIGYDKKDVNTFFESVAESYEQLYRSNAELKEKVETLTDGLQHYKSKEAALEKSLMLAEKDSEDTKSRANKEAKNIEFRLLVLPDHPTPIEVRTHTGDSVPYLLYDSTKKAQGQEFYNEKSASQTGIYWKDGYQLMGHLLEEEIC